MECYICHKVIQRHQYPNHVASHLAGNDTGMRHLPDSSLAVFSHDTVDYDHHGTVFPAHSTPPPVRRTLAPDRASQQKTLRGGSIQPNAFQMWLKNPTQYSPEYTTIDGQNGEPDSQARFRQAAEVLHRTTREEVIKIVSKFQGVSCTGSDKKACLELVDKAPIFPGLVAYTYTHLIVCPRHGWFSKDDWSGRISELKQSVENWSKSGHIQCILACHSIKKRLLEILRATKVPLGEHGCNSALLNGTTVLNYDILNLAAVAALCITGSKKEDILDQRGAQGEQLVELFHDLLEADVELDEEYRRCFLNPLIQFSKDSGYCPRGIYLDEGTITGLVSESQGGFGFVYKGMVGSRLVAVKALKRDSQSLPEYNKQVSKEAVVWRHLRHPNCLPLYGVYRMPTEGPNISSALVSPWMDEGTLFKYLGCNPNANRTQLILDVVRGLNYLHSMQPHVAHRDIKPDNILITSKGRACLADFGLVSTFDTDDRFHTAPTQIMMVGTYKYMAPEIFNAETKEDKRKVNKRACDMYALGCTIYAVYTGRHPFHEIGAVQHRAKVISNQRPEFPKGKIPLDMWSFVENLWGPDPSKRLTAKMALGWMETKARQEGVDPNPAPFEEEWEWKGSHNGECLWSVSI